MSVMFFSDLHLDTYRPFSTVNSQGFNSRLIDQMRTISNLVHVVKETQPDAVIFLGDMLNSLSESLPKVIYNAMFGVAKMIAKHAPLYILVGNHDIYKNMYLPPLLSDIPNVTVISKTYVGTIGGRSMTLVPWGDIIVPNRSEVLAGHIAVKGAWVNASRKEAEEGIDKAELDGYDYVFLGHFHEPQSVSTGGHYAAYIGSLMQNTLAFSPIDRGVTMLEDDGSVSHIVVPSPKIFKLTLNTQDEVNDFFKGISEEHYYVLSLTSQDLEVPAHNHRVVVEYEIEKPAANRIIQNPTEDLVDVVEGFIDNSNTKLDKNMAKKYFRGLL